MISNKLKKIATMRAKLVALEKSVAIERSKELAHLPVRMVLITWRVSSKR